MVQLAAQTLIQRRRLTTKSRYQLLIGFPCHNSEHLPPHNLSPYSAPNAILPYSHEPVIDLVYHKKAINRQCPSSSKLPSFCKNTPKGYFRPKTGDFNKFARPIPKCDLQCQSFTKTVTQHQNTVQM